ncbi:ATP-binding cassette domain-containing protein [Rickettsiales bacterium]|nr:ATP-binding cassette domain-containing protein [Rickettsiales bacterium]
MLTLNNLFYNNINISYTIFPSSLSILNQSQNSSNLLPIIAGLDKSKQINILWNNKEILQFYHLYSSDINFIPTKNNLDPNLTVKQNINFISCLSDTQILISSAITYFNLDNIYHKKIKDLNNNELQRVKLSQLILSPKTLWLLERPDQFLERKWQEKLFNLIATRIKEGGLVILTSDNKIFHKIGQFINLDDFTSKNI